MPSNYEYYKDNFQQIAFLIYIYCWKFVSCLKSFYTEGAENFANLFISKAVRYEYIDNPNLVFYQIPYMFNGKKYMAMLESTDPPEEPVEPVRCLLKSKKRKSVNLTDKLFEYAGAGADFSGLQPSVETLLSAMDIAIDSDDENVHISILGVGKFYEKDCLYTYPPTKERIY